MEFCSRLFETLQKDIDCVDILHWVFLTWKEASKKQGSIRYPIKQLSHNFNDNFVQVLISKILSSLFRV